MLLLLYCIVCYLIMVGIWLAWELLPAVVVILAPLTFPLLLGLFLGAIMCTLDEEILEHEYKGEIVSEKGY